jgi:ribonuclease HI
LENLFLQVTVANRWIWEHDQDQILGSRVWEFVRFFEQCRVWGLLRNQDGEFIWGFYGAAPLQNILFAEILAILHGLKLCWERGFRKVLCCSDSLLSVNLIKQGVTVHHRFANEISCIRKLLNNAWEVNLTHTLREGNACADVLAKLGANSDSSLVIIDTAPSDLARPLWDDAWGVEFIRE